VRIRGIANSILQHPDSYDIIAFQELWMEEDFRHLQEALHPLLPYSTYFYSGAIGSGLATFSRWPITEVEFRRFSISGRPEHILRGDWFAGKGIGLVKVQHPDGDTIAVLNTHVAANYDGDPYATHRLIQAHQYKRFFGGIQSSGDTLLVGAGDFNMEREALPFRMFFAGMTSPWAAYEQPVTFNDPSNTYSSTGPVERIDHILYEKGSLEVVGKCVAFNERLGARNISLSDHYGLTAEFRKPATAQVAVAEFDATVHQRALQQVSLHMAYLRKERRWLTCMSVVFAIIGAVCLVIAVRGLSRPGSLTRPKGLTLALIGVTGLLSGVLSYLEYFRAFGWVGEELAAHLQFLSEINHLSS
jgi:endonuclease/exonuclease/phosphatase family metal-dependent hydrolase